MSKLSSVELAEHYVMVGRQRIPLICGQIDYWLHPAMHWKRILLALRNCSLPMVACYVPWNFHELEDGSFDFVGTTDPQRNLTAFLDLASELGLYVFIRPGPWIYDHFADGGVPIHASDYHRLDPQFLGLTRAYFSALCEVLRPRLATNGGKIVLCQPDNEIDPIPTLRGRSGGTKIDDDPVGDTYFNQTLNGEYDDATSFRCWLEREYQSLDTFNEKTGTANRSWAEIDIESLMSEKLAAIKSDVLAYLEWYTTTYAAEITNMLKDEHIDVPFVLNTYVDLVPQNNCEFNQIADLIGGDYWGRNLFPWREVLRFSRHVRHLRCATKTPWSAEFQSITAGELIHIEGVVTPQNATYLSLLAMLLGLKGWNWYVFAERSVLYFAPINNYGGILHEYYDRFKRMHDEFLELDWPSFQSQSDCSLWFYRPDFWKDVQYSEPLNTPFAYHTEYEAGAWMDWFERLHLLDLDIDLFDPDAEFNRIEPDTALICAGSNRVAEPAQERLLGLVQEGMHLVFLTTPPSFDLDETKTDLFDFLPRPVHVDGRKSHLVVKFAGKNHETASDYLAVYDITQGEDSGHYERIDCQYGTCGYILHTERGKIVVLGFQPSLDLLSDILKTLGKQPFAQSGVEKVISSVFHRNDERAIVVVNTNDHEVEIPLTLNLEELQLDSDKRFQIDFRLAHQTSIVTGDKLQQLVMSLQAKSGEIVHITPAKSTD